MLPVLLHEKVIPSVGRLVVYSDHKVHAGFWDGMTLTMVWDFSSSCSEIQVTCDLEEGLFLKLSMKKCYYETNEDMKQKL